MKALQKHILLSLNKDQLQVIEGLYGKDRRMTLAGLTKALLLLYADKEDLIYQLLVKGDYFRR